MHTVAALVPPSTPLGPGPVQGLTRRWQLVRTVRNHEDDAEKAVKGLGLEIYLPREQRLVKYGRKFVPVSRPLFRQYLFTRFDLDRDPWGQIRRAHFVARVISIDEVPVRVPDRQLEIIRTAERAGYYDRTKPAPPPPQPSFRAGDRVRITAGPFAGLLAEIRRASPRRRIEILFQILGGETRIRIDRANVQRV